MREKPFFMSNPEWFTSDFTLEHGFPEDGRGYHLTDNAPQEAIDSYNEFYGIGEDIDLPNGYEKATGDTIRCYG